LSATEAGGPVKTATTSISWRPKVYFGVAPVPGSYTPGFVQGLASNALAAGRQRSIAYSAGALDKLYYAYPSAFGGSPSNFVDSATGFAAGFSIVATISITNAFGVTNTYYVWESDQAELGSVTINVT
jgi:hypothetical protein